jgi:DNA-binding NtrC family response regulator
LRDFATRLRTHQYPTNQRNYWQSQILPAAVEVLEPRMIEDALPAIKGNKQKAAQALGLSRQGLIKKLKRLQL